ncbi:MAG: hypothetical protein DRR08_23310 [Candidatus Parabeggiatoa sp. nov. 2]|nr:MAG: hypothetical protein B6247_11885 [Beggiatoa sp. 4572_84]RKZ55808.1 MAG: hypothetical protein DRR08_23310 [Gammaproteobacteria bacterium]
MPPSGFPSAKEDIFKTDGSKLWAISHNGSTDFNSWPLKKPLLIVVDGVYSKTVIAHRLVAKATTTNYKCMRAEIPTPHGLVVCQHCFYG